MIENRGALPKDHELGEQKEEKEQSSFYGRGLCLLTYLLMGDPEFPAFSPLISLGLIGSAVFDVILSIIFFEHPRVECHS
jgi:hypothetical protein